MVYSVALSGAMLTSNLLRDLLAIGESSKTPLADLRNVYPDLAAADHINRLSADAWRQLARGLNNDDLASLVKGLTIAEREFNWIGGSVTAVIWVFKELHKRDPELAEQVGDWVRQETRNEYAPSGSARWPFSYRAGEHAVEYLAHKNQIFEEETRLMEEARVRREQRRAAAAGRIEAQKSRCVAGIDGCRNGWILAIADHNGLTRVELVKDGFKTIARRTALGITVVDIPIGLPERGARSADVQARKMLQGRGCCVFPAPLRPLLGCDGQESMSAKRVAIDGKRVNLQMAALVPKIVEVDKVLNRRLQLRIREGHPEVSFACMNGGKPITEKKKSQMDERPVSNFCGSTSLT